MQKVKQYIEKQARGPHRFCNWVVYPGIIEPGRILMSAYPYKTHLKKIDKNQYATKKDFYKQVAAFPKGVTYICLQEKSELARLKLPIYFSKKQLTLVQKRTKVKYVHYDNELEIIDISVAKNDLVYAYVNQLYNRYLKGENFVIHCLGGHGRTGTIAALLMGFILAGSGQILLASELLDLIQYCHSKRVQCNGWVACPQTNSQCKQVQQLYYRFLDEMKLDYIKEDLKFNNWTSLDYYSSTPKLPNYNFSTPSAATNWQKMNNLEAFYDDSLFEEEINESDSDLDTQVGSDTEENQKKSLADWFCLPCFKSKPHKKINREEGKITEIKKDNQMKNEVDDWDVQDLWNSYYSPPSYEEQSNQCTDLIPYTYQNQIETTTTTTTTTKIMTTTKKGIQQLEPLYSSIGSKTYKKKPNTIKFEMSDLI